MSLAHDRRRACLRCGAAAESYCRSSTGALQSYVHVARLVTSRSDRGLAERTIPEVAGDDAEALRVLVDGGEVVRRRGRWVATAAGPGPIEARRRAISPAVRDLQLAGLALRRGAALELTALGAAVARSLDG